MIAKKYQKSLKDYPIKFQLIKKHNTSSFHLLPIRFDLNKTKMNYKNIFKKFRSSKLFVNLLHAHTFKPIFQKKRFQKGDYKNAEEYANSAISIPIFYDLKRKKF